MRLSPDHVRAIRQAAVDVAGAAARVWLFGSRTRDDARGGDVDLMLQLPGPVAEPAVLAARLSVAASRALDGRKVDVVLLAPNVPLQPIHRVALSEGILL